MEKNATVFSGKAVSKRGRTVKFKVETVWKGDNYETVYLREELDDGSTCGAYRFDRGTEYLVYSYYGGSVGACTRTHRLDEAAQDLAELGPGNVPPKGTTAPVPEVFREFRVFEIPPRTIGIAALFAAVIFLVYRLYISFQFRSAPDVDRSSTDDAGWFHP